MYAKNQCTEKGIQMHTNSLLKRLLRIEKIAIEKCYFEEEKDNELLIIRVRPYSRETSRCPYCGKRCPGYDSKDKMRRWRSLDFGGTKVYIEATAPRIK